MDFGLQVAYKYFEYCTNFERPDHSVLLCDVDGGTTPPTGPHYKAAVIPPNNKQQRKRCVFREMANRLRSPRVLCGV